MPVRATLRSLAHRNFRLFFAGQLLSLVGTWMQMTALPWLVYRMTDSPEWLAVVAFAGQFPACLLSPIAGVVADRVNKRRLLILTQLLSMTQAFALAALAFFGRGEVWPLLLISIGLSAVNAFDLTGRQAFLNELVEREDDLGNAIALNSATFNASRLVGPTLAGWLIALVGEWACFAFNGVSFLWVLAALAAIRIIPRPRIDPGESSSGGLGEGLRYVLSNRAMTSILILVALICFLAVPYVVFIPVFVTEVLHGGARMNGLMMSAPGLGALAGGMFVASRRNVLGLLRGIVFLPIPIGVGLVGLSYANSPWVAALLLFATGFGVVVVFTTCNTILQTIADPDKRGRVLSLYAMVFLGLNPLGGLAAGWLAGRVGVLATFRVGGMTCVVLAVAFVLTLAKPTYDQVWAMYRLKRNRE